MTLRTTALVLGLVAATLSVPGCGRETPEGANAETASPSQRSAVSSATLRELTLNVTGMS